MLLKQYKAHFLSVLAPIYDRDEAMAIFYRVAAHLHGWQRVDLALQPDLQLTDKEVARWNSYLNQLQLENPLHYVLGSTHFYGLAFKVTPAVLVPRPETEELVDWIIQDYKTDFPKRLLDVGTGSGCIAISLAHHFPSTHVHALDVSLEALTIAKANAVSNQVALTFLEQDILQLDTLPMQFDVIVSNPPYVRESEKQEMRANVLDHEPHLALFVSDNDPLLFYRKTAQLALTTLATNGVLYFEINQYLGSETLQLLKDMGFSNVQLKKDFRGNDRMIRASRH